MRMNHLDKTCFSNIKINKHVCKIQEPFSKICFYFQHGKLLLCSFFPIVEPDSQLSALIITIIYLPYATACACV